MLKAFKFNGTKCHIQLFYSNQVEKQNLFKVEFYFKNLQVQNSCKVRLFTNF